METFIPKMSRTLHSFGVKMVYCPDTVSLLIQAFFYNFSVVVANIKGKLPSRVKNIALHSFQLFYLNFYV